LAKLLSIAISTKPGKLGKVIFGMKAKIQGKLIFFMAQSFIGKLLNDSALTADHKPMTPCLLAQNAFNKPSIGQDPVSQIKTTK